MLDLMLVVSEFVMLIFILVGVAFVTLLERKVLGYVQVRSGPNKVGYLGVVQPFSDAISLFGKEVFSLKKSVYYYYIFSPIFGLFLFFVLWCVYPIFCGGFDFSLGVMYFFCVSGASVYIMFGCGWSSNSSYSLLGAVRGVAQMISYEVSLIFIVLSCVLMSGSFDLEVLSYYQGDVMFMVILFPLSVIWISSCLAETNRTPFDFAEGESELVSGFNVEYGGFGFAFIFMAEYGVIIMMSCFTVVVFFGGVNFGVVLGGAVVFLWIWVRGALPRFRYDKLMAMAWCSYLPISLNYFIGTFGLMLLIFLWV